MIGVTTRTRQRGRKSTQYHECGGTAVVGGSILRVAQELARNPIRREEDQQRATTPHRGSQLPGSPNIHGAAELLMAYGFWA